MDPESMVHALEQIHEQLWVKGQLIDIHPSKEKAEFIYKLDDSEHLIGYLQESDDYIEYHQADEAIQSVLDRGLFQVENAAEFIFHTHADSFDEMKAFLDDNWSDAVITDDVMACAQAFEKKYGEKKIVLREKIKIGVLKKTGLGRCEPI